jgi:hypothetical protein
MNIVCPRCKTNNSRWEKRCRACWLVFDVALRGRVDMPADSARVDSVPIDSARVDPVPIDSTLIERGAFKSEAQRPASTAGSQPSTSPQTQPATPAKTPASSSAHAQPTQEEAQQRTLAQLLGVEVVHVCALADAGIHTLEHVAESLPEQIGRALSAWVHINPAAVIAQARLLLSDPALGEGEPPPKKLAATPEPAEWWKMT